MKGYRSPDTADARRARASLEDMGLIDVPHMLDFLQAVVRNGFERDLSAETLAMLAEEPDASGWGFEAESVRVLAWLRRMGIIQLRSATGPESPTREQFEIEPVALTYLRKLGGKE